MPYPYRRCVLAVVLVAAVSGCAAVPGLRTGPAASSQQVPLPEIPAPVRMTIEKLTAGGEIRVLKQKKIDGRVIYHVEARMGEKDVEYDIASDGRILATKERAAYDSLPEAVKTAVRKYFGSATGLIAFREVQNDKTFYEVEGRRGDAMVILKLTDTGRIIEREKS
jgi:uncharacterized membrane protein YkoI